MTWCPIGLQEHLVAADPPHEDGVLGSSWCLIVEVEVRVACTAWWSRMDILCGGGHLLNAMVLEKQCPDVEVQHLRKWEYPKEEERKGL